jgi:uncharacterized protein (DUF1697 family)
MHDYIAFLRGINRGQRRVKRDRPAAGFAALAFTGVATFIAGGNVIFSGPSSDGRKLARQFEPSLAAPLGYDVATFVRTRAEVAAVAALTPFAPAEPHDPTTTIHVGFLAATLPSGQQRALEACRADVAEFRVVGRGYSWLCRGIKTHESKIWASRTLKALTLPSSSMRNLTTIRKLAALYPASGSTASRGEPPTPPGSAFLRQHRRQHVRLKVALHRVQMVQHPHAVLGVR